MTESLSDVSARLDRLERQNARLRRWLTLSVAALGLILLAGVAAPERNDRASDVPNVVRARQFQVVDGNGRVRMNLASTPDGSPYLNLVDRAGNIRGAFFVSDDARPALSLRDKDGRNRAMVGLEPGDAPFVALLDSGGKQVWAAP